MSNLNDLRVLKAGLLQEETRLAHAQALKAEIELAAAQDVERDRQVKLGRIRHLRIDDAIGGTNVDKWIDALQHWEKRDPGQPVTIDIRSPGGTVTDGLAIYDQLVQMRKGGTHVTTRGMGMVASMAAVLLQAGDRRIIDRHAKLLIHEGSITLAGTMSAGEQEDLRTFRVMLLDDLLGILAERSTLSKKQIQNRWSRRDWWLSAEDTIKFGFADEIQG